ncbi:MAG: ABC transporter permease, partial [Bifidobacteriaceae bacterium]|nr:ABC transporter permease [Bifidobacteriaceae bacterium]
APNLSEAQLHFQTLTVAAAEALEQSPSAPDIAEVVPMVVTSQTATSGEQSRTVTITGTTSNYFAVTNSPVSSGTIFAEADQRLARRVAVIGYRLADDFFPGVDPIGQTINVGSTPFTVCGVLSSKGSLAGITANNGMFVPLSRAERSLTPYGQLSSITLQATDARTIDAAAAEAHAVISEVLGIDPDEATFQVTTQAQLLETINQIGATLSTMLVAIAAISLVVGGIGVTNIMLVTVTERTREIGIRKALGASRVAISAQFVVEATILSLTGGFLGTVLAIALSRIEILGTHPVVTTLSVVLAAGVSIVIGVFFGGYPAIRASMLKPVDALRHD